VLTASTVDVRLGVQIWVDGHSCLRHSCQKAPARGPNLPLESAVGVANPLVGTTVARRGASNVSYPLVVSIRSTSDCSHTTFGFQKPDAMRLV